MNEISLKGISRRIIPYEIANIYGTISNPSTDVLNKNTDRLSLKIDLTDISGSERYEIENALKLALATVNNPPQTD